MPEKFTLLFLSVPKEGISELLKLLMKLFFLKNQGLSFISVRNEVKKGSHVVGVSN